jgi:hypothetical protein
MRGAYRVCAALSRTVTRNFSTRFAASSLFARHVEGDLHAVVAERGRPSHARDARDHRGDRREFLLEGPRQAVPADVHAHEPEGRRVAAPFVGAAPQQA